nr:hypothetical protein Iba_chr02bCG3650 [Ipomoea batatas]GMC62418.1 hypothetical protein Iba_chr02cCG3600 [Ipomoea batatas]
MVSHHYLYRNKPIANLKPMRVQVLAASQLCTKLGVGQSLAQRNDQNGFEMSIKNPI